LLLILAAHVVLCGVCYDQVCLSVTRESCLIGSRYQNMLCTVR